MSNFQQIKQKSQTFWKSTRGKRLAKVVNYALTGLILAFLIYQLWGIGWQEVLRNFPKTLWFYVLFLVLHFALPFTEVLIYRLSWKGLGFWQGFKAFTQKKILNTEVVSYSGEGYLYLWGKHHLKESNRHIFNVIKDNNIISAFSSTTMALLLLPLFVYFSDVPFLEVVQISESTLYIAVSVVLAVILLALIFRKRIISMNLKTTLGVLGLYKLRIIFMNVVEALQWHLVIPDVPIGFWLVMLGTKIVVTRIPLLPNQELLFINACLVVAAQMSMPIDTAMLAGMMLTTAALTKILNFVLYLIFPIKSFEDEELYQEAEDNE